MNKRSSAASAVLAAGIIAVAFVFYALVNHTFASEIIGGLASKSFRTTALYTGWFLAGFVVFLWLIVSAHAAVLSIVLVVTSVSLLVNFGYLGITKTTLTLDIIQWLPHEARQLGNAWTEYRTEIALAVLKTIAAIAVFLPMRYALRRIYPRAASKTASMLAVGAFLLLNAAGMAFQPPLSMAETNLYVFGVPALMAEPPEIRPVPVAPARAPLAEKVVLVVDESITHDAYTKLITARVRDLPVHDFGEAASTANCSAASNALLRWGVERSMVRVDGYDPRSNPMIWSYAKAAGFRTVLIDGQSHGDMHNYISTKEFALIDEFVPALADVDTDRGISAKLSERLRRPGREFIYVVKRGVHFPYEMNYPPRPESTSGPKVDKYSTAVVYATGGFFEGVARDVPFASTLMVYTSDHGQDFSRRAPHCNTDPVADEYSVPLVAITAAPALARAFASSDLKNRATHLNIFPTLLLAFGYEEPWLRDAYGPTLSGPPSTYLTYVNRGWGPRTSLRERHTVRPTDFVESDRFPGR